MKKQLCVGIVLLLTGGLSSSAQAQMHIGDGLPELMLNGGVYGGPAYQSTCPVGTLAYRVEDGIYGSDHFGGLALVCGYPLVGDHYVYAQSDRAYWIPVGHYTFARPSEASLIYRCQQGDGIIAVQHTGSSEKWDGNGYALCAPVMNIPGGYSSYDEVSGLMTPDNWVDDRYLCNSSPGKYLVGLGCGGVTPIPFTNLGWCQGVKAADSCPIFIQ